MTEKDLEMKERYIYQVIRRLPKNQREDIRMELNELIDDMCEHDSMEHVLEKLGDPVKFARKYNGENSYVIGPEYYDNYIFVLRIVLICVIISTLFSTIVNGIISHNQPAVSIGSIVNTFATILANIISDGIASTLAAFGAITLVFAIMERHNVKMNEKEPKEWKADSLPPIPDKKGIIRRSDRIVGMVFILLFGGIMLFAPELFGAYVFENNEFVKIIPVFNLEKWKLILPFLIVSFSLSFIDEMIQLIVGCYCKFVMIINIVTGFLQMIFAVIVLKVLPFWNMDFAKDCSEVFGRGDFSSKEDFLHYWGSGVISNSVLAIIVIVTLIEMGSKIYKTMNYGIEKKSRE